MKTLDVSDDSDITPLDALLIINWLNEQSGEIPDTAPPFCDVSGDGDISPFDALMVINFLNSGEGEGEQSADSGSGDNLVAIWRHSAQVNR